MVTYFPAASYRHGWEWIGGYLFSLQASLVVFAIFYWVIVRNYIKLNWKPFVLLFFVILILGVVSGAIAFSQGMSALR
jgi:hypothetical protein